MKFQRCHTDNCVYFCRDGDSINIIALYVNDMMVASSTVTKINQIIANLNKYVDDRGPISFYLGLEIERDGQRGPIRIHQRQYAVELLKSWNMVNSKPSSTPWLMEHILKRCDGENCKLSLRVSKFDRKLELPSSYF